MRNLRHAETRLAIELQTFDRDKEVVYLPNLAGTLVQISSKGVGNFAIRPDYDFVGRARQDDGRGVNRTNVDRYECGGEWN